MNFPAAKRKTAYRRDANGRSRASALWLGAVAALVLAMVVVGGATRLTGSGLSITEWRPVTGAVPPMSRGAWEAEFAKYRRTDQHRYVNADMTLDGFKQIYWWEWAHRLLGRLIGVVFFVPFVVLLALRRIPRRLIWRCVMLFALGGLQGAIGWWMVKSGLAGRVSVAPERLTVHLSLALLVFALAIWTALEAWFGEGDEGGTPDWRRAGAGLLALVSGQIALGALVAGNQAGRVFNDWPLMAGRLIPADYLEGRPLFQALVHSQAAVQFNHRIGAYVVAGTAVWLAVAAARSAVLQPGARIAAFALAGLVGAQVLLGIATLTAGTPLVLGLAHQLLAAGVLAGAVVFAWRVRRP